MAVPARDMTQNATASARMRSWHLPDPGTALFEADLRTVLPYLAGNSVGAVVSGFVNTGAANGDGRPAGVMHGDQDVQAWDCADGCPVAELDAQSGITRSTGGSGSKSGKMGQNTYGDYAHDGRVGQNAGGLGDTGGASRYFPVFRYQAKAPKSERPRIELADGTVIQHSTVKPLELMRWLIRLLTPAGGLVLDPFAGTGPVLQACREEGLNSIGTDSWDEACMLACARLGLDYEEGAAS